ncbi:MAG: DEAD/DEAH box helicase [Calothrix sp. FI2-JRJ7]|jgi:hypothetical protein|nr:DEAD/DEAH box helicase [Calothrix sp. FI2-JRJ7]
MLIDISTTFNNDVAENRVSIPRLVTCNNQAELLKTFAKLINTDTFYIQYFPKKGEKFTKFQKDNLPPKQQDVIKLDDIERKLPQIIRNNEKYDANVGVKRNQAFKDNKAVQWRSIVIEFDDLPKEDQIPTIERICKEHSLPLPTCFVDTGNKSYHFYWVFIVPAETAKGANIQQRFLHLFVGSDTSFKSVVLASRYPGFIHRSTSKASELYTWSDEKYDYEQLNSVLPKLPEAPTKQRKPRGSGKGFKASTPRRSTSHNTEQNKKNFIQEYEELSIKYNFYRRPTEEIEKEFKEHLDNISNAEQGTVRATLLSESRKIFGLVFGGLFVNKAYKELYRVAEERVSKQPNGNIDEAYRTINCAFRYAIDNTLDNGNFAEKPDYKFDADVIVNQEFLQDDVLQHLENTRILAIKSAIGTGKTQAFKRYIEAIVLKYPDIRICITTHRKNLINSIDHALANVKFVRYDDLSQSWAPSYHDKFITTVDSCHKLDNKESNTKSIKKYDLVVFDECDQLLEHLTTGSTKIKDHRVQALKVINYLIKSSKNIICASATLSNIEIDFLSRLAPGGRKDIKTVHNIHPPKKKKFIRYESEGAFLRNISRNISNNKKVAIACNSKVRAEEIYEKLTGEFPNKKIQIITSSNVDLQYDLVQSLINEKLTLDVDVIIYSSTLGTGFDISRIYFDTVFCFFTRNNALAATDLLQLTGRIRYPISNQVHVFMAKGVINQERDKQVIKNQYLDRCDEPGYIDPATGEHKFYDFNLVDTFLDYVAASIVRKNKSLYNLNINYWQLVADDGHEIINDGQKPEKNDADVEEMKLIKKELKQKKITEIVEAPTINSFEASKLVEKSKYSKLDNNEQSKLNKYNFSKNTGLDATKENITWYEYDGGKKACKYIELKLMPMKVAEMKDYSEQQVNGELTHVDFSCNVKRKILLEQLLQKIQDATRNIKGRKNIYNNCFTEETLSTEFTPFVMECVDEIDNYFEFTPDIKQPVKIATTILELVGLSREHKRVRNENNELIHIYWITEDSQKRRDQIVSNIQETRLKEWRQWMHSFLFNDVLTRFKEKPHNSKIINELKEYLGVEIPETVAT